MYSIVVATLGLMNARLYASSQTSDVRYDSGIEPGITYISSGSYKGDVAETHTSDDWFFDSDGLWYDVVNPQTGAVLVNREFDNGYNSAMTDITSGQYQGDVAEVHTDYNNEASGLWLDILNPDNGAKISTFNYDTGATPSITFISSGKYSGDIAEVHASSVNNVSNFPSDMWLDIINPVTNKKVFTMQYDEGDHPSIAFIPSGKYQGDIAEVHTANYFGSNEWLDIIDLNTGKKLLNVHYDHGFMPSITYMTSGKYKGDIAEIHINSVLKQHLYFDIIDLNKKPSDIVILNENLNKTVNSNDVATFIQSGASLNSICESHEGNSKDLWFNCIVPQ
jgi:hypothetical protein